MIYSSTLQLTLYSNKSIIYIKSIINTHFYLSNLYTFNNLSLPISVLSISLFLLSYNPSLSSLYSYRIPLFPYRITILKTLLNLFFFFSMISYDSYLPCESRIISSRSILSLLVKIHLNYQSCITCVVASLFMLVQIEDNSLCKVIVSLFDKIMLIVLHLRVSYSNCSLHFLLIYYNT